MKTITASELKYQIENAGTARFFFTRETMKCFGDTMKNYGVRPVTITTITGDTVDCWELYRRRKTSKGLTSSAYFQRDTLEQRWPQNN